MSMLKSIKDHSGPKKTWSEIIRWGSHLGAVIPLIVLIYDYLTSNLSANPIQTAEQRTGLTALVILVIMLAVTPFKTFVETGLLAGMKKRLGLYSFMYAAIHLLIFLVLDYGFAWRNIYIQIVQKTYILIGLTAFIILLAMAVTSFQWWKRKLAKNWKRLHRLVYLAAPLIVLHFALGQKGDVLRMRGNLIQPVVYGSIVMLLLILRLPPVKRSIQALQRTIRRHSPKTK